MGNKICSNPDCRKEYHINDNDVDDGFCVYECWEKVNCHEPIIINFEQLAVD